MSEENTGEAIMVSAPTRESLLAKLDRGDYTDSSGVYRLIVFNPDEERLGQARSIVETDEPNRGTYDIWFSHTSLLARGGKIAYVFPGFWDQVVTETDSLSDALGLPRMDQLIADMRHTHTNGVYYQRRYNTKWLCNKALEKLGVVPDMYLGYSLGEWEAALFAGIITCDIDMWTDNFSAGWDSYEYYYPLVVVDGADRHEIDRWCEQIPDLYVSIDNCPSQVILTGKEPALAAVTTILEENNITHLTIPNRTALHTPLVADIPSNKFTIFNEVDIQDGCVPVWSSATLSPVPTHQQAYLDYLYAELTKTVRFREAVELLYEDQQVRIFIQIGPGPLPNYVSNTLHGKDFGAISTSITDRDGVDQMRRVVALGWIEGGHADPGFIGVTSHNHPTTDLATPRRLPSDGGGLIASAAYAATRAVMSLEQNMESLRKEVLTTQEEMAELYQRFGVPRTAPPLPPKRQGSRFDETMHLNLDDCPYLIDHSIIRQPPGWPIIQDTNPVVPLTMIIELLADVAMRHAPGERLIKISNVIALRWMEVAPSLDVTVTGEWSGDETLRLSFEGYAAGDCTFAENFPSPDPRFESEIDLGHELSTRGLSTPEQWYEKLTFHGPDYQSLIGVEKICERGIVGVAKNAGGKGSLLDAVGQMLGLFVNVTQTEDTIVFPISVKELDLHADIHDQDGVFTDTMIVTNLTGTSATADTVIRRDTATWGVVKGLVLQRFAATPSLWQVILDPRHTGLASPIAEGVFYYENTLHDNMLAMLTKRYLSTSEREEYNTCGSPQQKREKLTSRIALKDAVRSFLAAPDGEMMYPVEFRLTHDDRGQPFLRGYGRAAQSVDNLHVSLSHKADAAVAIVSDQPVGIDLEKIGEKSQEFVAAAFTDKERELLDSCGLDHAVIRFWVAKEAYSKMRGEGLRGDPKRYQVSGCDGDRVTIDDTVIRISTLGDDIVGWTMPDKEGSPPPVAGILI